MANDRVSKMYRLNPGSEVDLPESHSRAASLLISCLRFSIAVMFGVVLWVALGGGLSPILARYSCGCLFLGNFWVDGTKGKVSGVLENSH